MRIANPYNKLRRIANPTQLVCKSDATGRNRIFLPFQMIVEQ